MEKLVAANEKQVQASTLPILRFATGNMLDNAPVIHFHLENGGTGPAIIESFRIKWNGQPTNGPKDLLDRCCLTQPKAVSIPGWVNIATGMTLPAGRSEDIFGIGRANADSALYHRLDSEARFKIEAEACYCSVLDECWLTDFKLRPRIVKACEPIPDSQRW